MADILLTNDDGYTSPGFYPLYKELIKDFNVLAVAPVTQTSWVGKSVTSRNELKLEKTKIEDLEVYTLNGTPADCVQIGLYELLEKKPKLVVSGINIGANTGHGRVLSSGTIGAGFEAVIDGIKAISASLHISHEEVKKIDYSLVENSAKVTAKIIKILYTATLESDVDLLSINMLSNVTTETEFEVTKLDRNPYGQLFQKSGNRFVHVTPPINLVDADEGTDLSALSQNKISITPISLELTSKSSKNKLNDLLKKEW